MRVLERFSRILFFLPALSLPAYADATDDAGLPSVQLMSCQGQCANFVPAKPIDHQAPRFPSGQVGWTRVFSEGILRLLYTVGPDGKVHDIIVLSVIGPKDFVDKGVEQVRTWTFEPATSDGKPVAQSRTYEVTYAAGDPYSLGAVRPFEFVQGLNRFSALMEQGKTDEARAKLEDVLQNVRLTFADRTAVTSPLADLAYKRGDYLEARRLAWIATAPNLPAATQKDAWLTRIKAELMLGDVSGANFSFNMLQSKVGTFAPDSALPKLIRTAIANANAAPLLTVQAQIPAEDEGDVYTFLPFRRTFTFQNIQGSLQKFVLACNQATMESDITPAAQWRIPNSWSGCSVYVRGAPRTKFLVVQPKE